MMDTAFSLLAAFVLAAAMTIYITHSKKNKWRHQQTVIEHLLQLKTVIAFTQKHRGMCAAYIQGDGKALSTLTSINSTLEPIIDKLDGDPFMAQQGRWMGYLDHWRRLSKQCTQLDLATSFTQHTNLITNLLYLFEDIAEQRSFDKKSFKGTFASAALWQDLPFTAEFIGQSRAVGVAIVARGVCTQVDKVKLGYLDTKIAQLSTKVFNYLERNGCQQTQLINLAKISCHNFTSLLQKNSLR
ncbi:hypothetical protein RS130_20170 [Paraglaciecola aquimarina]|uniref:Nitrate/nitrite sensing protein domain-containing protein n=1 Tax=Paraglaciecola aquimarina TaxID=1235557 RepID=A0ABU3T0Y0_9ALTE|nr:hypothetical protein [Paraglaciecola aquimarina]MDU0355895.1 hypothetical protein [Paraglaciecola aquimarina]